MTRDDFRCVAVGLIGRPHGTRGEVRLNSSGLLPRGLSGYTKFFVGVKGEVKPAVVKGYREHGRQLLVKFEGCDDPGTAARYRNLVLFVDREEMPDLEEGEFYHADLLGCGVFDESGARLGIVHDVFFSGAQDVMVVRDQGNGREWMVPVVEDFVPLIDVENATVVVRLPEGLVE